MQANNANEFSMTYTSGRETYTTREIHINTVTALASTTNIRGLLPSNESFWKNILKSSKQQNNDT